MQILVQAYKCQQGGVAPPALEDWRSGAQPAQHHSRGGPETVLAAACVQEELQPTTKEGTVYLWSL